jgi:hypothetical protein
MYQTPIHALPAPDQLSPDVGPDVPADIKRLADAIDGKLTPYSQGNGSPDDLGIAPGKVGRRHEDLLTGNEYLDIGTAWVMKTPQINPPAGVAGLRTLGNGALEAVAGNDPRLSDPRPPLDGSVDASKIAAVLKPSAGAAGGAEALRALGVVAGTAAAGNDARLADQRVPLDGSVNIAKLAAAVQQAMFSTGDLKYTLKRVADAGWILGQGQNLSKAGLPTLWAFAQAEIAAGNAMFSDLGGDNFKIADLSKRVHIPAGAAGGGLTAKVLGAVGGEENHVQADNELPRHRYWNDDGIGTPLGVGAGGQYGPYSGFIGNNAPFNIMQPFIVVNVMVKM